MRDDESPAAAPDGWWNGLYDQYLAEILLARDEEPTEILDFLTLVLRVEQGDRIFDQCCGIGSLSIPLALRGYEVVGCDLMRQYVERARVDAREKNVLVEFQDADAFDFVPSPRCAAAFNWWTSFGYARDDSRNIEMLRRACEALLPGGKFALDTMNVPAVIRGFEPEVTTDRKGLRLHRRSVLDLDAGFIHKRWTYELPDGREIVHHSSVRLHTAWELRTLLAAAGFGSVEFFGNVDGSRLSIDSPRCIAVATKERS